MLVFQNFEYLILLHFWIFLTKLILMVRSIFRTHVPIKSY